MAKEGSHMYLLPALLVSLNYYFYYSVQCTDRAGRMQRSCYSAVLVHVNALHLSKVTFNKQILFLCVNSQSFVLVIGRPCFHTGCSAISAINVWVISVYSCYSDYFIGP